MAINGLLTDVRWQWAGTETNAALLVGDATVTVINPFAVSVDTEVWIAGSGPYEVTDVDIDTGVVTFDPVFAPGDGLDVEEGESVVPDVGGRPSQVWVAEVILDDSDTPVEVPLTIHDLSVMPEGQYDPPRTVLLQDDLQGVVDLPGSLPEIQGELMVGPIPTASLSDGDPPDEAAELTFIGGIGSVFFRWTEISNADPVTYRLHVRDGDAPTTDGTYEVAAGVGLTFASVRKLKDGSAIVGDGTVIYYGIVTVEDADGPGPNSDTEFGIPAQVTTADIAVGAITANLLVANDAFIDALTAVDLTATTITGPTIQTAASGKRMIFDGPNDILSWHSGLANETHPGSLDPSAIDGRPAVTLEPGRTTAYDTRPYIFLRSGVLGGSDADVSKISMQCGYCLISVVNDDVAGDSVGFLEFSNDRFRLEHYKWLQFTTGGGSTGNPLTRLSITAGKVQVSSGVLEGTMGDGSVGTGTYRDSVDSRVTALAVTETSVSVSASGSFTGSVTAIKQGTSIALSGGIVRATGFNAAFADTGMVLPVGYRPSGSVLLGARPFYTNPAAAYEFQVLTTGVIQVRQSAANANTMSCNGNVPL